LANHAQKFLHRQGALVDARVASAEVPQEQNAGALCNICIILHRRATLTFRLALLLEGQNISAVGDAVEQIAAGKEQISRLPGAFKFITVLPSALAAPNQLVAPNCERGCATGVHSGHGS